MFGGLNRMNCPLCGCLIFAPGCLAAWHDPVTGALVNLYALCQGCFRRVDAAAAAERRELADTIEARLQRSVEIAH